MPDRTAQTIIDAAYRKNGILIPTTAQRTVGLADLQDMLSSWSTEGLLVPWLVKENFTLTSGQAVYTIGVTGDSPDLTTATGRPVRIVRAFIRISSNDYPVSVDMSERQYNERTLKDTETRPTRLWYDPQYPNGTIRFNYEADSAYDFHITAEKTLVNPTALTTEFSVPLEYNQAMVYNLAIRLAPDNDNQLPQEVFIIAATSLTAIENRNSSNILDNPVSLDRAIYQNPYDQTMEIRSGGY